VQVARDVESLKRALQTHLRAGCRLTAVTPLSTGHSNETYLLDGLDQILRLPPTGPSLTEGLNMAGQFQLYAILGRLPGAPPVPRVIYYSDDSSVLGSPFYIVQHEPGTPFSDYEVPTWWAQASESFRDQVCCQYVRAFASLTALQPLDLLGPIATPVAECKRWQHFARTARHDTLVGLAQRLIDIPHPSSGPPAPVHGDPKMANVLWAHGKLQSVLDWELAFNGEPLADLGYMLSFFANDAHAAYIGYDLPGVWTRAEVIREWERVSQRSAAGVEWFEAAAAIKTTCIMAYGHHLATTGQVTDARYAGWVPYIELWIGIIEQLVGRLEDSHRRAGTRG
jgi:aminoglycoside phosphotransferase (APT) family kinase protein